MTTIPRPPDVQGASTRPYLIRALHEWCTDHGLTPYLAVQVDESVLVPHEYVKNGEIVLNVGFDATQGLKLGNELIEFRARFGGVAREIAVPVDHVIAIYARENGQGMAFPTPLRAPASPGALPSEPGPKALAAVPSGEALASPLGAASASAPTQRPQLRSVGDTPAAPKPAPALRLARADEPAAVSPGSAPLRPVEADAGRAASTEGSDPGEAVDPVDPPDDDPTPGNSRPTLKRIK